jgi:hypothetical protein
MKSLIASALVVVSVALAGPAAQAATVHKATHVAQVRHAVAGRRVARLQPADPIGQFVQLFFGGQPWRYAGVTTGRHSAYSDRSSSDSSAFDTSVQSPTYDSSPSAPDTTAAAIQSMNDEAALNASMAAAEQQNDAANAATLQTEINAGM